MVVRFLERRRCANQHLASPCSSAWPQSVGLTITEAPKKAHPVRSAGKASEFTATTYRFTT